MQNNIFKISILALIVFFFWGCTEPYALQTNTFEEALVIEATLTNELKKQEIKISRTYKLEENGPTFETEAIVYITDNMGNQYYFKENNGKYESEVAFQTVLNRDYKLFVITKEGKTYESNVQRLTTINPIESVQAKQATKEGERGVEISVNSYDPTNTSKYYRYTYQETSKVTVPYWLPSKAVLIPVPNVRYIYWPIGFVSRVGESEICYTTTNATDIILKNTVNQSEDRVNQFPVRFISNKDYTIAERYSILVTQYVQNLQSYTFYNTLKKITGSGSILSQTQPGAFVGNISCTSNPNEKVLGFFEVSSVSYKRFFFSYSDIFPNEALPPYFDECKLLPLDSTDYGSSGDGGPAAALREGILSGTLYHYSTNFPVYIMVKAVCSDCTTFSSNVKPAFWID